MPKAVENHSTPITRRALLAFTATVPLTATADAQLHPDALILAAWDCFRQACTVLNECGTLSQEEERLWDAQFSAAQDTLADTPARTAEGLAVQLRYLFWNQTEGHEQDALFAGQLPDLGPYRTDPSYRLGRTLIATIERSGTPVLSRLSDNSHTQQVQP